MVVRTGTNAGARVRPWLMVVRPQIFAEAQPLDLAHRWCRLADAIRVCRCSSGAEGTSNNDRFLRTRRKRTLGVVCILTYCRAAKHKLPQRVESSEQA